MASTNVGTTRAPAPATAHARAHAGTDLEHTTGVLGRLTAATSQAPWSVFPRMQLHASASDLAYGLSACVTVPDAARPALVANIEKHWTAEDGANASASASDVFVCLSVRTGFDLLLATLALPRGSEVICTAITIKDMVTVIEAHGLVPVPCDLDTHTLAVHGAHALDALITPRTVMVLGVHVFGAAMDMAVLEGVAKKHRILLVEDCAESYRGDGYRGSAGADVSMFSFGTIKTGTAFGGAVFVFKGKALLGHRGVVAHMRTAEARYPTRPRLHYFKRLFKYACGNAALTPVLNGLLVRLVRLLGLSYDELLSTLVAGFAGDDFFAQIRQRPSAPLLALLVRRFANEADTERYVEQRIKRCEWVAEKLSGTSYPQGKSQLLPPAPHGLPLSQRKNSYYG